MPTRLLTLLLVLVSTVALAGPGSTQKRLSRRMDVDEALQQLVNGAPVGTTVSRLRYLGEDLYAVQQLTGLLRRTLDERPRRNLAATLAGLESRSAEGVLAQLIGDEDGAVRMYAAQGMGRLRSRRVDLLLPLLEDKSSGVRKAAATALGASRNPKMSKPLVTYAKDETELEVRTAMLVGAGEAGDIKQAPGLKAYLTNDSEGTRFAAARGLCLMGSPDGFAFAEKLLGASDRFVRRQGLALFEGSAAKKAGPTLRPLLEDKDRGVAAAAARILYQGGDPEMLTWLVTTSWTAKSNDEKLIYEKEIEPLQLADDRRKAILKKAGLVK
ncbi:HEAT repeat domain-containing protein [Myxococcaceae bacterium GXIMD 01537]